MTKHIIVTNNPSVIAAYPNKSHFCEGGVMDIFENVRNAIHKGARLISHPLSGSIKPCDTPYKSVVISSDCGLLDYKSLQIIEDAIGTLMRMPAKNRVYNESILCDFRIIDLDHISSAL